MGPWFRYVLIASLIIFAIDDVAAQDNGVVFQDRFTSPPGIEVRVNITGGGDATPLTQFVSDGAGAVIRFLPNEGHGLTSASGCSGAVQDNLYVISSVTVACTIELTFAPNEYTITFESSGGSPVAAITQDFGTHIDPPDDPTKEGYGFLGWSPPIPSTMAAQNVTLTAQWQAFYLSENGVTIHCPNAEIGETGVIKGVTYTKRTQAEITVTNAQTTCTSGITNLSNTFDIESDPEAEYFNADISHWDTSAVINMGYLFNGASSFNQDIGHWDTSSVTNMSYLFSGASSFNKNIGGWETGSVIGMVATFKDASSFNQNIGDWNTTSVISMTGMFSGAQSFNQDISSWDTSSVQSMSEMFLGASAFNQPIGTWKTGTVWFMDYMFHQAGEFNQDIGNWDTSGVFGMSFMFSQATSFNQDIGRWDTGNVTNMNDMFVFASSFNQDLSSWCVAKIFQEPDFFRFGATAWTEPKPNWGSCP